jgi:DNA-binding beta-propeller fold protein YncE
MRGFGIISIITGLLITVGGCSAHRGAILSPGLGQPVWPKRPDQARIRFIGGFGASSDLRPARTFGQGLRDFVYGPDEIPKIQTPHAVAVDDSGNRVAIADTTGGRVFLIDLSSNTISWWPDESKENAATQVMLGVPTGVVFAGETLCISDAKPAGLILLARDGSSRRVADDALRRPAGIAFDAAKAHVLVVDSGTHEVVVLDRGGTVIRRIGGPGGAPGKFNFPSAVAIGRNGMLAVSDSLNFRVQLLTADGQPITSFGQKGDAAGDLALPKGVAIDDTGNVWVVDAQFENIQAFDASGQLLMAFGGEGQGAGEFWLPAGIHIDDRQRIWVADSYNRRVQVFEILTTSKGENAT